MDNCLASWVGWSPVSSGSRGCKSTPPDSWVIKLNCMDDTVGNGLGATGRVEPGRSTGAGSPFVGCDTAGSEGNEIVGNAFVKNRNQVKYVGTRYLDWSKDGRGNYWSDNPAFDLDGDGIARVAHARWGDVLPLFFERFIEATCHRVLLVIATHHREQVGVAFGLADAPFAYGHRNERLGDAVEAITQIGHGQHIAARRHPADRQPTR